MCNRKFEIYSMAWRDEVNLDNLVAAAAQYGGPVAVRRDEKKIVKVQGSGQPIISLFSSSGIQITSLKVQTYFKSIIISKFKPLIVEKKTYCSYGMVKQRKTDLYLRRWYCCLARYFWKIFA